MGGARLALVDLYQAKKRIHELVRETPLVESQSLGAFNGGAIRLKLEHHQLTGSFKLRGATNAVLNLTAEQKKKGVVGVSTGNFGRGLAYAAKQAGVRCVICMSNLVPDNKVQGIKALGAEVRIVGRSQDEAQTEVDRLVAEQGMVMLDPFDQADVIAGQGTLGLELMAQWPQLQRAVVPLSGGGLISGVALAIKSINPSSRIIAVTMERGAAMYESIRAGKPVQVEEYPSLADSLGGGIGLRNQYTFDMVKELVDDFVLVSEKEIAAAIRHAYWQERQIIEGGGAVAIAALLSGKIESMGNTVLLLSGCNIDMALHHRIIGGEDVQLHDESG